MRKILGVIGGLGPMATAYFMELVIRMTGAERDQDHIDMLVRVCPSIPDRTDYIVTKTGPSPVPGLRAIGTALTGQGAGVLAIPCVTAHCFLKELDLPVLDALTATARTLREAGIKKAGLLATDGTLRCGYFAGRLRAFGITPVIPSPRDQAALMTMIYEELKRGRPVSIRRFRAIAATLRSRGAQVILLGCTELSLIRRNLGPGYLDVLEVLAREAVLACGGKLRPEYENLMEDRGEYP